ncbi:MAG TPA: NrsF family protein [Anaeromyxobacteraceae bacterium]|nr:NrsF family protein [Anaeromyxobacteraceae bacterium]
MTIPDSLRLRVLEAARRVPSPARSRGTNPAGTGVALAAVAMLAVLFLAGGPGHAAGRPASIGAWIVAGLAALAAGVTWLVVPPRRSMLPPPASRLIAVAVGVPIVLAAWLLAWHGAYDDPFARTGLKCFALTVAAAPWPFAVLVVAGPRFAPDRPWLVGAALGAAAGAWAAIVVELWCPLADPGHVAIGHALPLVALVVAGALLGGRWLRLRRVQDGCGVPGSGFDHAG